MLQAVSCVFMFCTAQVEETKVMLCMVREGGDIDLILPVKFKVVVLNQPFDSCNGKGERLK